MALQVESFSLPVLELRGYDSELIWAKAESRLCEMEIGCAARKKLSGGSPEVPEPGNQLS